MSPGRSSEGVSAAVGFIEAQLEAGLLDGGVSRCKATTRKGKACQRTPLPEPRLLPVAPAPRAHDAAAARRGRVDRALPIASRSQVPLRLSGTFRVPRMCPAARVRSVSHDADKLIRQLSLVAFLMAERRPLTARDVKGNVEGYSEMSDEAFARRFYSDRAELTALGIPLTSQRDEFTGEELYTLRSEHYFLDQLELDEDELAALQTALYTLEGKFAYAEPLRLALQNLALGRPGFRHAPTATAERVRVTAPDYSPELAARLSKLETAISKQRTIQFRYWSPGRDRETERRLNPYALRLDEGVWYVIGHDLDRDATRTFRVARIRSDIRFATRRERDYRLPADFDVEAHRVARPWQIGPIVGTARIEVQGDTAWWVRRTLADAGTVDDGVFETPYATLGPLVSWILRQNGRAIPLEPAELRDEVREALAPASRAPHGRRPGARARAPGRRAAACRDRQPAGPVAPERFGVLQALLAHLLAACGDERTADLDADELAAALLAPARGAPGPTLSLLNLVNFGGGCYTVYAEVDEDGAASASTRSSTATSSARRRS